MDRGKISFRLSAFCILVGMLFLCVSCPNPVPGVGAQAQWAQTVLSCSNESSFLCVATDSGGNVYAVGYVQGSGEFDFGNSVTVTGPNIGPYDNESAILVKYDPAGTAQWAQIVKPMHTSYGESRFKSVAVDAAGDILVGGEMEENLEYGFGNSITATGSAIYATYSVAGSPTNAILVKYNSLGLAQWARTTTSGSIASDFSSISLDATGSIYAAGRILGTESYGFGNSVTAKGTNLSSNIVLVKFDASGVAHWARTVSASSGNSEFNSVAADSAGNIYAAGTINGTGSFNFGDSVSAYASIGSYFGQGFLVKCYLPVSVS